MQPNKYIRSLDKYGFSDVLAKGCAIAERRWLGVSPTGDSSAEGMSFRSYVLDSINATWQVSPHTGYGFTEKPAAGIKSVELSLPPGESIPILSGQELNYRVENNVPHYWFGNNVFIVLSAKNGPKKVKCYCDFRRSYRSGGLALQPELPFGDAVVPAESNGAVNDEANNIQRLVLLYRAPNEEEAGEYWLAIPENKPGNYFTWAELEKLGGRTNPKEPDRLYPKQSVQSTLDKDEEEFLVGSMDETGNGQGQVAGGSRQ